MRKQRKANRRRQASALRGYHWSDTDTGGPIRDLARHECLGLFISEHIDGAFDSVLIMTGFRSSLPVRMLVPAKERLWHNLI